jgi:hypothetical protein
MNLTLRVWLPSHAITRVLSNGTSPPSQSSRRSVSGLMSTGTLSIMTGSWPCLEKQSLLRSFNFKVSEEFL